MNLCDLCHAAEAVRRYPTRPAYDEWFACAACSALIEAPDPAGLYFRALGKADEAGRATSDIRQTHQNFWYTIDLLCEAAQS